MKLAGDVAPAPGNLPMPPRQAGTGVPALFATFGQLGKLLNDTLPDMAYRLASDTDYRKATGTLPK